MAAIAAGIEISTPVAEPDTEPERIIKRLVLRHPLGRDEQSHGRDLLQPVTRKMCGIVFAREARIGILLPYRAGEQAGHEFVAPGALGVVFDFILGACRRSAGGERQNGSEHRGNERRTGWCHGILPSHLTIARHSRGAPTACGEKERSSCVASRFLPSKRGLVDHGAIGAGDQQIWLMNSTRNGHLSWRLNAGKDSRGYDAVRLLGRTRYRCVLLAESGRRPADTDGVCRCDQAEFDLRGEDEAWFGRSSANGYFCS